MADPLASVKRTTYESGKGGKGAKAGGTRKPVAEALLPPVETPAEPEPVPVEQPEDETYSSNETSAKRCRVYGGGIEEATVRQHVRAPRGRSEKA